MCNGIEFTSLTTGTAGKDSLLRIPGKTLKVCMIAHTNNKYRRLSNPLTEMVSYIDMQYKDKIIPVLA